MMQYQFSPLLAMAVLLMVTILCCPCIPAGSIMPTPAGGEVWTSAPRATATPSILEEGEVWVVGDLAVSVLEHELTGCVSDSYGEERCPPEGAAYLWIHLHAEHVGDPSALPVDASFSTRVFYRGQEQEYAYLWEIPGKPRWPGYSDGSGDTEMYSGAELDGWLAFTVPAGLNMDEVEVHLDNWRGTPEFEQRWRLTE